MSGKFQSSLSLATATVAVLIQVACADSPTASPSSAVASSNVRAPLKPDRLEAGSSTIDPINTVAPLSGLSAEERECTETLILLELDGSTLGSRDSGREIDILQFSWGASIEATSTLRDGSGAGKVARPSFRIVKKLDSASPVLKRLAETGETIAEGVATLSMTCEGQREFLIVEFKNVQVTSWSHSTSSGRFSTEEVAFTFEMIELLLPAVQKARD